MVGLRIVPLETILRVSRRERSVATLSSKDARRSGFRRPERADGFANHLFKTGMRPEHSAGAIVDRHDAGCGQQLFHPFRMLVEIDGCAPTSKVGDLSSRDRAGEVSSSQQAARCPCSSASMRLAASSEAVSAFRPNSTISRRAPVGPALRFASRQLQFTFRQKVRRGGARPPATFPQQRTVVFVVMPAEGVETSNLCPMIAMAGHP